jgi:hypothetical protein
MHFLGRYEFKFRRHAIRACVTVLVARGRGKDGTLEVVPGSVAVMDAEVVRLPDGVMVVGPGGEVIAPTWGFWVTTESIDPYHLLTDWDGNNEANEHR